MRKMILLLFFLAAIYNINAQAKVRPGLKSGLNVSSISNLDLDNTSGIYAGAFAHIRFSEIYTMQLELLYSAQGGKANTIGESDLEFDYILFSMANKLFVSKKMGFHFIVGPSLELNLDSNRLEYDDGEWIWNDDSPTRFDIAIFAGIGYEFNFGLILEARYKQGFLDVADFVNNLDDDLSDKSLNSMFQIGAAYKFDW
ncbi:MAG: porin family protein [Aurantibacter sp.]